MATQTRTLPRGPITLLRATGMTSGAQYPLKRDHVQPHSVLERDLVLVADAHESAALVQRQRRLVGRGDARDDRVMAVLLREEQEPVEDAPAQALAPPAVFHVDRVLRGPRVGRLGTVQ